MVGGRAGLELVPNDRESVRVSSTSRFPSAKRFLGSAAIALLAIALIACGSGDRGNSVASTAAQSLPDVARERAREDAVRLMIQDWTAGALPRPWDLRVLHERMRRYMARDSLDGALRQAERAIKKIGRRNYWNAWLDSATVGEFQRIDIRGRTATVVFVSAGMLYYQGHRSDSSLRRWTVNMLWENGRWRLRTIASDWLTPEGPMGDFGSRAIKEYPEHVVFRNPRPRPR